MPTGRRPLNLFGARTATASGSPTASRERSWPAIRYTAATPDYYTLAGGSTLGLTGRSITVSARIKPATTPSSSVYVIGCLRQNSPPTTSAGWILHLANSPGTSEPSFVWAVFGSDGGNNFYRITDPASAASYTGKSLVVTGRWDHSRQKSDLFVNGKKVATGTSGSGTWDIRETTPLIIGEANSGGNAFDGNIGWTIIHNRAVSDADVAALADDAHWPFVDDYDLVPPYGGSTFSTTIGARTIFARTGSGAARTFTTRIEALSDLDGSQTGGGETLSGARTFSTTIGVRTSVIFEPPTLRKFKTIIGAGTSFTLSKRAMLSTTIGVSTKFRRTINGRADLINTAIYRR